MAKFSNETVAYMRKLYAEGNSQSKIAKLYKISQSAVSYLLRGLKPGQVDGKGKGHNYPKAKSKEVASPENEFDDAPVTEPSNVTPFVFTPPKLMKSKPRSISMPFPSIEESSRALPSSKIEPTYRETIENHELRKLLLEQARRIARAEGRISYLECELGVVTKKEAV